MGLGETNRGVDVVRLLNMDSNKIVVSAFGSGEDGGITSRWELLQVQDGVDVFSAISLGERGPVTQYQQISTPLG